jgi:hypothetical protein
LPQPALRDAFDQCLYRVSGKKNSRFRSVSI